MIKSTLKNISKTICHRQINCFGSKPQSYYEILEVKPTSTLKEVRSQFLKKGTIDGKYHSKGTASRPQPILKGTIRFQTGEISIRDAERPAAKVHVRHRDQRLTRAIVLNAPIIHTNRPQVLRKQMVPVRKGKTQGREGLILLKAVSVH